MKGKIPQDKAVTISDYLAANYKYVNREKTITLWHAGKRKGTTLSRDDYNTVKDFIMSLLKAETEVALSDLISRANADLSGVVRRNIGWTLLQVKRDLESRKIINTVRTVQCVPKITLTSTKGKRNKLTIH